MANFNINDLDPVSVLNDTDLFEVQQGGINLKATGAQLKSYFAASAAGADIMRMKGDWSGVDTMPGGSGTKKWNVWRRANASTIITTSDGSLMPVGLMMMAIIDNPRNVTDSGWVADWMFWYSF